MRPHIVAQEADGRYPGDHKKRMAAMQRFAGMRKSHAEPDDTTEEVRRLRGGSRLDRYSDARASDG